MKTESIRLLPFVRWDFMSFFPYKMRLLPMVLLVVQYVKNEIDRRTPEEVVIVREPAIVSSGTRWWESREVLGLCFDIAPPDV